MEQLDNFKSKKHEHLCGVDYLNIEIQESSNEKIRNLNSRNRKLKTDYTPIRILVDTTYLEKQAAQNNLSDKLPIIKYALNKSVGGMKKLLEVEQFDYNIYSYLNQSLLNKNKIFDWDEQLNNTEELSLNYDYVLLTRFIIESDGIPNGVLAGGMPILLEGETKRPIVGLLMVSTNATFFKKENVENYFSNVFIHELTHAFGFLADAFKYFPGGEQESIFNRTDQYGISRSYVKTPKVVEFAKKYYGCESIEGVEVENQGTGGGQAGSHWEGRILLGEYMTSENYEDEVVISEFTLALLEDSGWYKTNYYTGGLMRFGKNKGCDFLTKYCLSYDQYYNDYITHFNDEFFSVSRNWNPSCTTGRLSRAYNVLNIYNSFDNSVYYQLLPKRPDNQYDGGALYSADYCPVNYHLNPEYEDSYFVGNCKRGNGNYGTNLYYTNSEGKKENSHPNSELPSELGEKYSNNSFCMMSSLVPKDKYPMYGTIFHPMCFPSYCSSLSLTILIYDQYIVCPRQGGNVEVEGYSGKLHCPDYNLICTGTVMCNDLFDCIDKKSESKYNTYTYDYERLSTQDYYFIPSIQTLVAGELTEEGICPKNCVQCTENKKCKKCIDHYNLIGERENDNRPILCDNKIDINEGYYLKDKIYYPCHSKCKKCSEGPVSDEKMNCDECKKGFNYNKETKNCEEVSDSFVGIIVSVVVVVLIIIIIIVVFILMRKRRKDNDFNTVDKETQLY